MNFLKEKNHIQLKLLEELLGKAVPYSSYCQLTSKEYKTEDLTWMVLSVNNNGQIELISENPTQNKVFLADANGYLYAESKKEDIGTLDKMCDDLYGKGNGAQKARSLNVDDINKIAGINTDEDKKALSEDYGTRWKYRYNGNMQYNKATEEGFDDNSWVTISNSTYQSFWLPGTNEKFGKNYAYARGESSEIKYTLYGYKITDKISIKTSNEKLVSSLLCGGKDYYYGVKNQWLASNYVACYSATNGSYAQFGVYSLSSYSSSANVGRVMNNSLRNSYGNPGSVKDYYVRPVVVLDNNIKLIKNQDNEWDIQ